ncbi:MAG: CYTH domain-containing protein [Candidatus Parcubacteria bacterium]|nr:CYTH domain-containing protein [Candidatus Parcubacteria bacterium]
MKNIECEIRSFLTEKEYKKLITFFKKEATFLSADEQITYYFDSKEDLRIQKNDTFAKIWMKKGKIHDEHREELEIKVPREDFEKLEKLFLGLGYSVEIKWFRKRHSFVWEGIDVAIDFTRGYGYIIELEKMTSVKEQEKTVAFLKKKLSELHIPLTPKEEFAKKYEFYKKNWKKLIKK